MTAVVASPWGEAIAWAVQQVAVNAGAFAQNYPDDCTCRGLYRPRPAAGPFPPGANRGWTTGFVPGTQWAGWRLSGDLALADAALAHVASFARRIQLLQDTDTHDMGFLYTLSCSIAWNVAADPVARQAAVKAADQLLGRVLAPAGIIQAWGNMTDARQRGRTIIDSLMNMPLLYWVTRVTGDDRYAHVARTHTCQLRDHFIRGDGTTFHTFSWDADTGVPLRGDTAQGHADGSCWARGQAWALYGFALGYRHTNDTRLLEASGRCAEVLFARLPKDHVPYWDLVFGDDSGQPRDSSAGAIAACGLLELASLLPVSDPARQRYQQTAADIVSSLTQAYRPPLPTLPGQPLLLHGVYNLPAGEGVDEGNLWGDYFYLEALLRLSDPAWQPWW